MNIKKLFDDANIPEEERLYIYGDPAYTGSSAIMGAYKRSRGGQLTAARKEFNKDKRAGFWRWCSFGRSDENFQ